MSQQKHNERIFNWAINLMTQIPIGNFYHADRYDTDTEHIIHLWDEKGNSYDFRCPRSSVLGDEAAQHGVQSDKCRVNGVHVFVSHPAIENVEWCTYCGTCR